MTSLPGAPQSPLPSSISHVIKDSGAPARILARVDAAYKATHARLVNDERYRALTKAAEAERKSNVRIWIARNRLHLYVETHTPLSA